MVSIYRILKVGAEEIRIHNKAVKPRPLRSAEQNLPQR
jgi:hypothetical protein